MLKSAGRFRGKVDLFLVSFLRELIHIKDDLVPFLAQQYPFEALKFALRLRF